MDTNREHHDANQDVATDPLDFGDDPAANATYQDTLTLLRLRSAAKAARHEAALTQTAVAERMSTTQSAISDLESGRTDAQLSTWQRYARALGKRFAFSIERPQRPSGIPVAALALSPVLTELSRTARARPVNDISLRSRLPEPLVSQILVRLRDEGWALESGEGESATFSLVHEAANAIGISLHADRIVGALIDLKGRLRTQLAIHPLSSSSPENVVSAAVQLTEVLFHASHVSNKKVLGVGVCLAGVVDASSGRVKYAPDLQSAEHGWSDVDLEALLQERIQRQVHEGLRVAVSNDAKALALSHYQGRHFESAEGHERAEGVATSAALVLMSGGGVGAGFIANGDILQGFHSAAGEFGHLIVDRSEFAPECRVGLNHRGCLETVATVQGILTALALPSATSLERKESLEFANIRVAEGNRKYFDTFFEAGKRLGSVIPLISFLDAEEVAIYCSPALHSTAYATGHAFQKGVTAALAHAEYSGVVVSEYPPPRWFSLEEDTLARGAGVAMLVSHFLHSPSDWYPGLEHAIDRDSSLVFA